MSPFHRMLPLSVLILTLATGCKKSELTPALAEKAIQKGYPVDITIRVPKTVSAAPGSAEHARLLLMNEHLPKTGWFVIFRKPEGERETFEFKRLAAAPPEVKEVDKGWTIPAAKGLFVKALGMKRKGDEAQVRYEVRLSQPTANFKIFQVLNPKVKLEETRERVATFKLEQGSWVLKKTNETF